MAPARALPKVESIVHTRSSRWGKSPTTFGPVGRVLCTIGLVGPFVFFVVIAFLTGGFTIFGVGVWGGIIMPWGLHDVWKVAKIRTD